MIYTYKNFSEAKLAVQLGSGDSTMTVTAASTLPTSGTFIAVIWNAQLFGDAGKDPDVEIVLAVHSSGYVYNLTRAQELTTAKTHVVGTTVGLYLTAAAFSDLVGATGPQGPQGPQGVGCFQVFTSSGTFTAPAGVTQVLITAIGAGAGGVAGGNTSSPGAGGSAGAMVINYPYTVTAGNSYTVTLNNPGGSGANGGTTVFDALTIAGGISGGGAGEPDGGASSGGTAGAGGFLTAKTGNAGAATGTGMNQGGGGGGGSMFGAGGAGASGPSYGAGSAGTGYGSGGGGGASGDGGGGGAGGSGTKGILIVQW